MEEQNKEVIQEQDPKQEHTRITLSSFLYKFSSISKAIV